MSQGGKRQGAGRKKGYAAKSAEEARRYAAQVVTKALKPIFKAIIKKAKQGDIRAATLLLDRAFGKTDDESKKPAFSYNVAEIRERYIPD